MRIVAVGRIAGEERALFERYRERVRPTLTCTEVPEGRGAPVEIMRREAAALLAALPDRAWVVALDRRGLAEDSPAFARRLEDWLAAGRSACFVVGGAEGLDDTVLARADHRLSLGPATWPHMLARVMLAEQLWRARAIAAGHPYHR